MSNPNVVVADATKWVASLEPKSATCAIFDPPFPGMERHVHKGTTTRLIKKGWFPSVSYEYITDFFEILWGAMAWDSHVYMFADQDLMLHVVPEIAGGVYGERRKGGWTFWKSLIWYKHPGKLGGGYHGRGVHELICVFEKGNRKFQDLGMPDVLAYPRVKKSVVPTQKPVDLLQRLVKQSSLEGDLIIDPFCGSGSTGVAALGMGREFAGCDVDEKLVVLARDRMRERK